MTDSKKKSSVRPVRKQEHGGVKQLNESVENNGGATTVTNTTPPPPPKTKRGSDD